MPDPRLFPSIPYTHQRGREASARPHDHTTPFLKRDLALVRRALGDDSSSATCPRCASPLAVRGPTPLREGGGAMWLIRCATCGRTASLRAVDDRAPPAPSLAELQRTITSDTVRRAVPYAGVAAVAHVVALGLLIVATRSDVAERVNQIRADTTLVYVGSPTDAPRAAPDLPALPAEIRQSVASLNVPVVDAPALPSVAVVPSLSGFPSAVGTDARRVFTRFGASGVPGGRSAASGGPGDAFLSALNSAPELLTRAPLEYPPALWRASIEGEVVLRFVVDSTGRADSSTVEVVRSSHSGFEDAAVRMILRSLFRPGHVGGRPARVPAQLTVEFKLTERRL